MLIIIFKPVATSSRLIPAPAPAPALAPAPVLAPAPTHTPAQLAAIYTALPSFPGPVSYIPFFFKFIDIKFHL